MNIRLKEEELKKVLEHIEKNRFTSDGCACGEWGYQLDENLHLYAYRSCRRSSMTPDEKLWQIHHLEFYKKAEYHTYDYKEKTYYDSIEVEEEDKINNITIDAYQKEQILNKLKEVSLIVWGQEYRYEA